MKKSELGYTIATKWEEMRGDTELEKRLNHYLTEQFIFSVADGMPDDECFSEAKEILNMVKQYG